MAAPAMLSALLAPLRERIERAVTTDPVDRVPLLNRVLALLSFPYGLACDAKRRLYASGLRRPARLDRPVVSVGNLAVGGTGKTPFAIALAAGIARAGLRPLLLNKDYGGADPARPKLASDGDDLFLVPPEISDEAALAAACLLSAAGAARHARLHPGAFLPRTAHEGASGVPVVACRDRRAGHEFARASLGYDLLLLDDGFQHHELHRDFDIVLLDAVDPWAGGARFPLGRLREPLARLAAAHAVVLAGAERIPEGEAAMIAGECRERYGAPAVFLSRTTDLRLRAFGTARRFAPDRLAGRRILSFCALGNPRGFRATLEALQPAALESIDLPDHAGYPFLTLARIERVERHFAPDLLVTTAKDAVKLPPAFARARPDRLLVLERDATVDPALLDLLLARLGMAARKP